MTTWAPSWTGNVLFAATVVALSGPTPAIGAPALIIGNNGPYNSGSPSSTTLAADIPIGSCVVIALNTQGGALDTYTNFTDSAGNAYQIVQQSQLFTAFAICVSTTHDMPIGTSFTATLAGASQWNIKSGYTISGVNAVVNSSINTQTGTGTSCSVSTGALPNNTITLGYVNGVLGTITEGAGFTTLLNNGFNLISYEILYSSPVGIIGLGTIEW